MSIPSIRVRSLDCKQGAVRAVRFNVDGNYCLTCGSDKSVKLWNPLKGIQLRAFTGHGYEVLDARGSCDNSQIASCGMDKTVILWDVSNGSALRKWRGHAGTVNCVLFNEDSSCVLSGSLDGMLKVWDVRSKRNEPIQTLDEFKDSVTSIDVSDHEIIAGSADKSLRRFDLRNGALFTDYVGYPISSVSFTRDGQCILVNTNGEEPVKLFDKTTGELLQEFLGAQNKKNYRIDATLNHTDKIVISGSDNGFAYFWDLVEGSIVGKLDHSEQDNAPLINSSIPVHSLTQHPTKPILLTATSNKINVWSERSDMEEDNED